VCIAIIVTIVRHATADVYSIIFESLYILENCSKWQNDRKHSKMNNGRETKYSSIALEIDKYMRTRHKENTIVQVGYIMRITSCYHVCIAGTTGSCLQTLIFIVENRKGTTAAYCHYNYTIDAVLLLSYYNNNKCYTYACVRYLKSYCTTHKNTYL